MLTNDVISFEQPGPDKEPLIISYILDEKLAHTTVSQKTILCYSIKRKNVKGPFYSRKWYDLKI